MRSTASEFMACLLQLIAHQRTEETGKSLKQIMTEIFTRWDVIDKLYTDEDASLYLEAAFEEDLGDGRLIRAALSDIARARNMSQLAREIGMSREEPYKALPENGNPNFYAMMKIIGALGMRLRVAS